MKNILFFGATGRLGKNWLQNLIKNNKVFININQSNFKIVHKNVTKIKLNLNNKKNIINFIKKNNIDLIINCIALTNIELCEQNKKKSLKVNYVIPSKIFNFAKKMNIHFVHISTDMLYPDSKKKSKENSKLKIHNHYSKMKIRSEHLIKKYKKSLIIRTNFFGFSSKDNPTFSDKIIFDSKKNRKTYLWGDVYFTPVYVGNLIKIINFLIQRKKIGIYNISSTECVSKYNFGIKISKILNLKNKIFKNKLDKNLFVNRPNYMCTSNTKLIREYPVLKKNLSLRAQLNNLKKDFSKFRKIY